MPDTADHTLLSRHGLRPTRQRVTLYTALCGCASHPTAEQLHRMVSTRERGAGGRAISLATVYNTLQAFAEAGLAHAHPSVDGCRWDADTHDHVHVRLTDTNELLDVPDELGEKLLAAVPSDVLRSICDELSKHLGITVEGVSVHLTGRRRPSAPART